MTLLRVDVGFVSADRTLVDFFARVFELQELPSITLEPGTVCRLQAPASVMKVMLPAEAPDPPVPASPFYALAGLRYLTLWVDDIEAVIGRAVAEGGRIERGPVELVPGVRIAVLEDPQGNAIEVAQQIV
jgi:predicted enzyme related to lactoylglutathione lyase